MSTVATNQTEIRLERLLDEGSLVRSKYDSLMGAVNAREDGKGPTETESETLTAYRERLVEIDAETDQLSKDLESTRSAIENSNAIRRALAGDADGFEVDDDGNAAYRSFYQYAYDRIITRDGEACAKIAASAGGEEAIIRARERLQLIKRAPANTLSSNVGGLQPPQFIDQIFQVINKSRPLVDKANKTALVRGQLTYPKVVTRPVVAVQASEKTEAGNQGMEVDMVTIQAQTYLGGGDLSWQAINWSTPDALQLWFDLAAADYALKTEQAAAKVLTHSAFAHIISSPLGSAPDFPTIMTAIGAGYAKVYADSGRIADTVILSPDRFGYLLGTTSTPQAIFVNVDGQHVGPLNLLTSRGLDAGEIVVGDMAAFLCAETPGAPVELRVIEPAIGGLEVGLIGAFEAAVVDDGGFALITTAS